MQPRIARKKPWYLALALLATLAFGVGSGCHGQTTIGVMRASGPEVVAIRDRFLLGFTKDEDRAILGQRVDEYLAALDHAKNRAFPLAVAELLIGAALVAFGLRAWGGRRAARVILLQLVAAQLALDVLSFLLLRDVRHAQFDYEVAAFRAEATESTRDAALADAQISVAVATRRLVAPLQLGIATVGTLLIVIALTRPRARAFFEAPRDTVS